MPITEVNARMILAFFALDLDAGTLKYLDPEVAQARLGSPPPRRSWRQMRRTGKPHRSRPGASV